MTTAATYARMISRRSILGLAFSTMIPLSLSAQSGHAATQAETGTWMYAGNPARTGEFPGPGLDLAQNYGELWRIDLQPTGYFVEPCGVADGIAYYTPIPDGITDAIRPLIAVDAQTGEELWRHDPPVAAEQTYFAGTPAIVDGLLVMGTYTGLLVGLDAKSGEERWTFDIKGAMRESRPVVEDGVLYISDIASVSAVKLGNTPEFLWKTSLADGDVEVVSPTVSVDGEFVVVSTVAPLADPSADEDAKDTVIHVLNVADGSEAYRYQFQTGGEQYQFALKDGVFYSRSDGAYLQRSHVFSMTVDGTYRWHFRTATDPAYPAFFGDLVYVVTGDSVWGHGPSTGEMAWQSTPLALLDTDLVVIDGVIYIGTAPPVAKVYALNAADGSLLATMELGEGGATVVGITNGVLVARVGVSLVGIG